MSNQTLQLCRVGPLVPMETLSVCVRLSQLARFLTQEVAAVSFHLPTSPDAESELLASWIEGIKAGNQAAAAELVRHYEPEVRRFVRFRLNDPRLRRLIDSVDVCQSVMVRFFQGIQAERLSVEHPLQLLKLLTTMARNSLLDHARKVKVRRHISGNGLETDHMANVADRRTNPSEKLEEADLVDLIRSRMRPDEQRALDQWLLGQGWEDMSQEFNCEPDALRKRLTRAIDRATKELGLLEDEIV